MKGLVSNWITDDIKTCEIGGWMVVWAETSLFMALEDFPSLLWFSLIFMNMQIRYFAYLTLE